ncbi:HAD family phosphatase [Blastococcus sp. MG754426]|uniref:HAD family hydrolase n=1 Tax=unclassified Blastococcus TaxID=2619396 RepID=UPI001EF0EC64|nr:MULTISPECIES: HAD family phosphatase [unclassified Blastococcus]MCF6509409.1 HAD family phosphatase [Blastococcus sp. MG754426]MCF6513902.1 HAD family phosphatase [Blastococcus sp. MG754427]MCF6736810.1 HAD family phosphatase [Blastococcus sp. KM273129]
MDRQRTIPAEGYGGTDAVGEQFSMAPGGSVQALLFDLDGTLVDTREANYLAYRDAFAESGHELTSEQFATTWGRDSRDFIPDLLPGIDPSGVDTIRTAKSRLYAEQLHRTSANAALISFLRLVAPTHRTALVSTAKSGNGRQILATHGLVELFDVVVWGDEVTRSKPDPEGYLRALELLGADAAASLAFEDSETGRQAALAAGLMVLEVPHF